MHVTLQGIYASTLHQKQKSIKHFFFFLILSHNLIDGSMCFFFYLSIYLCSTAGLNRYLSLCTQCAAAMMAKVRVNCTVLILIGFMYMLFSKLNKLLLSFRVLIC